MTVGHALILFVVIFTIFAAGARIWTDYVARVDASYACRARGGVLVQGAVEKYVCVAGAK